MCSLLLLFIGNKQTDRSHRGGLCDIGTSVKKLHVCKQEVSVTVNQIQKKSDSDAQKCPDHSNAISRIIPKSFNINFTLFCPLWMLSIHLNLNSHNKSLFLYWSGFNHDESYDMLFIEKNHILNFRHLDKERHRNTQLTHKQTIII